MIAEAIAKDMKNGSLIRKMFEEGERLKAIYGTENVYDFSIGNPDFEPPAAVVNALRSALDQPGVHRYMPNAGFADVRKRIAENENRKAPVGLNESNIVMTVGAAGGLNVALKAILNPGEEVLVLAPYFVEYLYYIRNHGGVPVIVPTDSETFQPDVHAIAAAINPKTKAIIINSPNNPTGVIYSPSTLQAIATALEECEKRFHASIYVLSDEPYARLCYEGTVPATLSYFRNGVICNSFSKSLSVPGERIGYLAVNPAADDAQQLVNAMTFANRILGFVNAPSLLQKAVGAALDSSVDIDLYRQRRDMLYQCLTSLGMECIRPSGAFYLFPKISGGDDLSFAARAAEKHLLVVPGTGFGWPGYVRLAYCIDIRTIERSLPYWEDLLK